MLVTLTIALEGVTPPLPEIQPLLDELCRAASQQALLVEDLQQECGGEWGSHPTYLLADWMHAIDSFETRLGYWEWVNEQLLDDDDEDDANDDHLLTDT